MEKLVICIAMTATILCKATAQQKMSMEQAYVKADDVIKSLTLDEKSDSWRVDPDKFKILIGTSSVDI